MMLKLAVASEAQAANDSNDGCGVGAQPLSHSAHTEQHVLTRVLEDRADNFLPLDAELIDAFREVSLRRLGLSHSAFHHARGLPNSGRVSTREQRVRMKSFDKSVNYYLFFSGGYLAFQAGSDDRL
jgi:hypothetical protein